MHPITKRILAAVAGGLFLSAATTWSQEDKFASCPDPEAARKYVKQCLQANPYNTQEVCEERALEEVCRAKR